MANYRTLLFDVDDTLLDFTAGESVALDHLITAKHLEKLPNFKTNYLRINAKYWQALELQKVTRQQLITERFEKVMQLYHRQVDGAAFQKTYSQALHAQHQVVTGARQLLTQLQAGHYRLVVITNGIPSVQYQRLTASHLLPYFDQLFISEKVGVPKPNRQFFQYVAEHLSNFDPRSSLVIGDSLSSDIQGAVNAGLDSVWFNPTQQTNASQVRPTYTVHQLAEIPAILKGAN